MATRSTPDEHVIPKAALKAILRRATAGGNPKGTLWDVFEKHSSTSTNDGASQALWRLFEDGSLHAGHVEAVDALVHLLRNTGRLLTEKPEDERMGDREVAIVARLLEEIDSEALFEGRHTHAFDELLLIAYGQQSAPFEAIRERLSRGARLGLELVRARFEQDVPPECQVPLLELLAKTKTIRVPNRGRFLESKHAGPEIWRDLDESEGAFKTIADMTPLAAVISWEDWGRVATQAVESAIDGSARSIDVRTIAAVTDVDTFARAVLEWGEVFVTSTRGEELEILAASAFSTEQLNGVMATHQGALSSWGGQVLVLLAAAKCAESGHPIPETWPLDADSLLDFTLWGSYPPTEKWVQDQRRRIARRYIDAFRAAGEPRAAAELDAALQEHRLIQATLAACAYPSAERTAEVRAASADDPDPVIESLLE